MPKYTRLDDGHQRLERVDRWLAMGEVAGRALVLLALATLVPDACTVDRPAARPPSSLTHGTEPSASVPAPSAPPVFVTPAAPSRSELAAVRLRLTKVVAMKDPVALASRPGDPSLYVGQRIGQIWTIHDGTLDSKPILDIRSQVTFGGERGLFSLAFSPDGTFLYVSFTDTGGADRVAAYAFDGGPIDPSSGRTVLRVPEPSIRHQGGDIVFGPDGYLWMGLGDGSLGNDAFRTAQSLETLLGKIIRIEPSPTGGRAYRVPSDNPFVTRARAKDEIRALVQPNGRLAFKRDLKIKLQGSRRLAKAPDGELYALSLPKGVYRIDPAAP